MIGQAPASPLRVLGAIGLGTSLSLIGDTALYTVLPTHLAEAGVSFAVTGILLSANRWIRLLLNGPAGVLYDRSPRRPLFVGALFTGALSTALYATPYGFWPLFAGRILWGIAWAGIWIGGNTIVLDIAGEVNRGRWVGVYHMTFFMGAAAGALLGGILTDLAGYRNMMITAAALTLTGALAALVFLPETRDARQNKRILSETAAAGAGELAGKVDSLPLVTPSKRGGFLAALALLASSRLLQAGVLLSTLALYLAGSVGDSLAVAGFAIGVTSLTGIMLSLNALVSMIAAPSFGGLSDRIGSRWRAAAAGLLPGIGGFSLLAFTSPLLALLGVPLTAVTGGSSQSLSIALVEEAGGAPYRSRRLGILFTTGDLASAAGPLLAYALIPLLGIDGLYSIAALVLLGMFFAAWRQSTRPSAVAAA